MFKKFPKITNIGSPDPYNGEYINNNTIRWVATEKIDGCNVSIIIDENRNVYFAGRTQLIGDDYNIYQLQENIKRFDPLVKCLIEIADANNYQTLNVFGEYYGNGIQNRIFYCKDKTIRIYTALINGTHWLSYNQFYDVFGKIDSKWLVPVLGTFDCWESAVKFAEQYGISNNLTSQIGTEPGEGVVFYPADKPIEEHFVAYKYKTDSFKENKGKSNNNYCGNLYLDNARNIVKDFVNLNRGYSVASKIGMPKDKSEIGKFLSMLVQDALEDAKLEFPEVFEKLSEKDYKKVCNLGDIPYKIYLQIASKIM